MENNPVSEVNKTIQKCIHWSQRKNELPAQSTDEMI